MKKILIFLITFFITFCCYINVNASTSFYEAEYIDGIYMNKQQANSSTIYYQKARFFRETGTNRFAYCIDPFVFFNEGSSYDKTITPDNLSQAQKEKIELIAYFGYGYKNHTDYKWYAITQMMIWQTADPSGKFYFTSGLNGPAIAPYNKEINEINLLIKNYKLNTSLKDKTFTIIENNSFEAKDSYDVLRYYQTDNEQFNISGNTIKAENLTAGNYTITLTRTENNYNKPILFYQSKTSQALMQTGDIKNKEEKFHLNVIKTKIEITKLDSDTNSKIPSGDGVLAGAIYGLYDENDNEVATITIDENNIGTIENIPFGKYYIKEIKAPTGYELDEKIYPVEINSTNYVHSLTLKDKIIKKEITIYKTYDENIKKPEANISFSIYDKNNNLVTTIKTDENGKATVTLPYGEYKIVQDNTTPGYNKVNDFTITVKDNINESIILTDYKIKVPNTNSTFLTIIINIIKSLLKLL